MAVNKPESYPSGLPSIRQQQILDAAADNPDAPMEDLADEIPSVTTELVERVLEEYGDPADDEQETPPESADSTKEQKDASPNQNELSPKQREVLRAIFEQPTASQREIAETLDVSGPTVCNRVNSITGFNWDDREAFAEAVFETEPTTLTQETPPMASNGTESKAEINQLRERITGIEQQITNLGERDESNSPFNEFSDLELTHKVAHACLKSDAIGEDEELQIMKVLLG